MKPRTTPTDRRGGRRVWREGSKEGQGPTHAPDTAPEPACPRRPEPTDRNWMGRPSPEHRSRLTFDRSPVRKSRTPGSARGAGGNSCSYRDNDYEDACLRRLAEVLPAGVRVTI